MQNSMAYSADENLAQTLLSMGALSPEELQLCQERQQQYSYPIPLAFILIEQGYLQGRTLQRLVASQRNYFQFLARYEMEHLLGRELVELDVITAEQLRECQKIQARQIEPVPLVFILEKKGYLNAEDIDAIIHRQTHYFKELLGQHTKKFGEICVRKGWIKSKQLRRALEKQQRLRRQGKARRIGQILLNQGLISPEQVQKALIFQGKRGLECPRCAKSFNATHYNPKRVYPCPSCGQDLVPKALKPEVQKLARLHDVPHAESILVSGCKSSDPDSANNEASTSEMTRQIKKAILAIEQALEESYHDEEAQEALAATSTTWWMAKIDDILKQSGGYKRRYQSLISSNKGNLDSSASLLKSEIKTSHYFLGIFTGLSLALLTMLSFYTFRPNKPVKSSAPRTPPTRPAPSSGNVLPDISSPASASGAVSKDPNLPPENQAASTSPEVSEQQNNTKATQSLEAALQSCEPSAHAIREFLQQWIARHKLKPEDLPILQNLFNRFPQQRQLHLLIINALPKIKNPACITWLEEILQTSPVREKTYAIKALVSIGGPQALQVLLIALRRTSNEWLIMYIALALTRVDPASNEIFQEVTNQFYQCQKFKVRSELLSMLYNLRTGQEGNFLLKVIADSELSQSLRIKAIRVLYNIARREKQQEFYHSELLRLLSETQNISVRNFLRLTLKKLQTRKE